MEKNTDFNNFGGFYGYSPFPPYEGFDPNLTDKALEYKIKCKEFEKLNEKDSRVERRVN